MTAPPGQHPHARDPIPPHDGAPPRLAAAELVVHGLLEFLHLRSPADRERRIQAVLGSLSQTPSATPAPRRLRFPRPARWLVATAAVVLFGLSIMLFGLPGESSAHAELRGAIAALRSSGDRRFEIRVLSWTDAAPPADPNCTVDTRAPGLMVLKHRPPGQAEFTTVGRDARGTWAIGPGGQVLRNPSGRYWPPFATLDGESMFNESVDGLLESLPGKFDLSRTADAAHADFPGRTFTLVRADRRTKAGHLPHHVDLYVSPATRAIERIEFRWDSEQRTPGSEVGPRLPRREPHDHDEGLEHGFGRGDGPDGPGGRELGGPGAKGGPGGPRPDHDHEDGPPRRKGDGMRPPPPDHDHDDMGPGGKRPPPPPDHDEDHEHGPGERGGPRGNMNQPGYPRLILFQRVAPPQFPPDWFSPAAHAKSDKPAA